SISLTAALMSPGFRSPSDPAKAARNSYLVSPGRRMKQVGPSENEMTQSSAPQRGHCLSSNTEQSAVNSAVPHNGHRLDAPEAAIPASSTRGLARSNFILLESQRHLQATGSAP